MDGVRKINEDVMKNGRALIITTNTVNKNNLPNGTLFISNDGDLKYLTRDNNEIPKWENFKFENIFNDQTFDDSYFLFLLREPLREDERERATISSRNHNQAFIGEILHLTLIFII